MPRIRSCRLSRRALMRTCGVRGALGAIPLFGSAAVEFLNGVLPARYERRREKWMLAVYETLMQLLDESEIRDLEANEAFQSALAQALPVATATHYEEKLRALRNVVVNAPSKTIQPQSARRFSSDSSAAPAVAPNAAARARAV